MSFIGYGLQPRVERCNDMARACCNAAQQAHCWKLQKSDEIPDVIVTLCGAEDKTAASSREQIGPSQAHELLLS